MKRKIVLFFLIIISFLLQTTFFRMVNPGAVIPNLMIIITSCFGFMRGKQEGLFVGFFCGFLVDIMYGGGILGLYALIYMIIGYLNGMFHHIFYPEDVKLPILFVTLSDLTYCFMLYIFLFLLRRRMDFFSYLKSIILPEMVGTVVVTIIIYRLILMLNMRLEKDEREKEAKFA